MANDKLGRPSKERNALLRGQVSTLLWNGKIETTATRAKELSGIADKMITLGKRGDLHARRQALAYIMEEDVVTALFEEIAPKYADRNGGYTRIIKTTQRKGDGAPMAIIELV